MNPSKDRDELRTRVADLHARGWTLSEVANELGCSPAEVEQLLRESRGRRTTSATAREKK